MKSGSQLPSRHPKRNDSGESDEPLPLNARIGYGAGGIGDFLFLTIPNNMALPVFSRQMGMDPAQLGVVLAVPRIAGVIADSWAGIASDNHQGRIGRRKPFILAGAVVGAALLPMVWLPGPGTSTGLLAAYLVFVFVLYSIAYSAFSVPYQALGYELSRDYDERTRVQAWKGYLSGVAYFMAPWFFWFATRPVFADLCTGTLWLSVIGSCLIVLSALVTVMLTREKAQPVRREKIPLMKALAITAGNRRFLCLQAAYLFMFLSLCCGGAAGFFLLLDYVCRGDQGFFGLLSGVSGTATTLSGYLGLFLGVTCSAKFGKRTSVIGGLILIFCGILLVVPLLAPSYSWLTIVPISFHPWFTMVPGIVMNVGFQACTALVYSMTAEICDADEKLTGVRREGAYAAVSGMLNKVMTIFLLVTSGALPWIAGYHNAKAPPTLEQLLAMKGVLVAVQIAFIVLALVFAFRFREESTDVLSREGV